MKSSKTIKGFTLIELLVVVAIIGILAAVGVVAYNGYTKSAKISVVKTNHNKVKNYIINEINKCYNLDVEFDSITNKSYQTNPSTNCSTNAIPLRRGCQDESPALAVYCYLHYFCYVSMK